MTQHGNGDGWLDCACGNQHWGIYGAAGLAVADEHNGTPRLLMQHRALWSHRGGTWGIPGGARDLGESSVTTALREAGEEAGVDVADVVPRASYLLDHGTWSYATVLADVVHPFPARATDPESVEIRWVALPDIAELPLLPAFSDALPTLRAMTGQHVVVIVDAANVVATKPFELVAKGWWRDRALATRRLRDRLATWADWRNDDGGMPAAAFGLPAYRWWPRIVMVTEGSARGIGDHDVNGHVLVEVIDAPADGDSEVVAQAASAAAQPGCVTLVATADRELRGRVEAVGARAVTSDLLSLLSP